MTEEEFAGLKYDVRMDGVVFALSSPTAPFALSLPYGNTANCFAVQKGPLYLRIDFPTSQIIELVDGDVVALSGLTPHVFSDRREGLETAVPEGELETYPLTEKSDGSSPFHIFLGTIEQENFALSNLVSGPVLVKKKEAAGNNARIWAALDLLDIEFDGNEGAMSQDIIVRRISEIILINMMRWQVQNANVSELNGAEVLQTGVWSALASFFEDPYSDWPVDKLASKAGMSRTKFMDEFRIFLGETPAHMIRRIRLTLVARKMLVEKLSLEETADLAQYNSVAAFIRGFQSVFGDTPSRWLKKQA